MELERLMRASAGDGGALVVLWGRRRLGKSRLLIEWCQRTRGMYWVADESASAIQRQYLAEALSGIFPGFAEVTYPDWRVLLDRLSREARQADWHGPLVLDEFPYLVSSSPELPSILQRWTDAEKLSGGVLLALAGSSQRMMFDHVLDASAPLFGRACEILHLQPLMPGYIGQAVNISSARELLDFYTCWGGVPRYWELARTFEDQYLDAVNELVLSPLGVLHNEVNHILRQEIPSGMGLRPLLDAIGMGAHKSSEIAARLQTPATSLTRGLKQVQELGYVRREVPYGEDEKCAKRALYRLADPFLRMWFKVVAPHRGALKTASKAARMDFLNKVWPQLQAAAWEEICRMALPHLGLLESEWSPASRYWQGNQSEWDAVSGTLDGATLLLGECKSLMRPASREDLEQILQSLKRKTLPFPATASPSLRLVHALFVPELGKKVGNLPPDTIVLDGEQVFAALKERA